MNKLALFAAAALFAASAAFVSAAYAAETPGTGDIPDLNFDSLNLPKHEAPPRDNAAEPSQETGLPQSNGAAPAEKAQETKKPAVQTPPVYTGPARDIKVKLSGRINHDTFERGQSGSCSISEMPRTMEEFQALQAKAAKEPQGAVAVLLAAMEIYKNDEVLGKKCLELSMYRLYPSILSLMKGKLRDPESNGYSQHFINMAYFKGASPENNYTPNKPYTVEVSVNSGRPYQKLTSANANVLYLRIATQGADSPRPIEVIKPAHTEYFVINNASSIISQVKFPVK